MSISPEERVTLVAERDEALRDLAIQTEHVGQLYAECEMYASALAERDDALRRLQEAETDIAYCSGSCGWRKRPGTESARRRMALVERVVEAAKEWREGAVMSSKRLRDAADALLAHDAQAGANG